MNRYTTLGRRLAGLLVLAAAAGCSSNSGSQGASSGDSIQTPAAAPATTASSDTGMGAMAGMDHGPAQDADQEFLRMMLDHHAGLIQLAHGAQEKQGASAAVQEEARKLDEKQDAETEQMQAVLKQAYNDAHEPMVMPKNRAMIDSLAAKSGADYDMGFRMNVIAHHQEGIAMIDQYLPRLKRPEVRQMAERMKADQTRDIQEIQSKMGRM